MADAPCEKVGTKTIKTIIDAVMAGQISRSEAVAVFGEISKEGLCKGTKAEKAQAKEMIKQAIKQVRLVPDKIRGMKVKPPLKV